MLYYYFFLVVCSVCRGQTCEYWHSSNTVTRVYLKFCLSVFPGHSVRHCGSHHMEKAHASAGKKHAFDFFCKAENNLGSFQICHELNNWNCKYCADTMNLLWWSTVSPLHHGGRLTREQPHPLRQASQMNARISLFSDLKWKISAAVSVYSAAKQTELSHWQHLSDFSCSSPHMFG